MSGATGNPNRDRSPDSEVNWRVANIGFRSPAENTVKIQRADLMWAELEPPLGLPDKAKGAQPPANQLTEIIGIISIIGKYTQQAT